MQPHHQAKMPSDNNDKKKKSYANRPKRSARNSKRKKNSKIGQNNERELTWAKSRIEIVPFNEHYSARVVHPYPYTFSTFAKKRWCNRKVLDVYCTEFGSYPSQYYKTAIESGRILMNGKKVRIVDDDDDDDNLIRMGDFLSHMVHRHEPAVLVSNHPNNNDNSIIDIVHESDDVIVVDKPSTMPTHPCGGYHLNSLFHALLMTTNTRSHDNNNTSLFPVHRLDRLTSGLTVIAKSSDVAKEVTRCIMDRSCQKYYLARVRGKFPLNAKLNTNLLLSKDGGKSVKDGVDISIVKVEEDGRNNSSSSSPAVAVATSSFSAVTYWISMTTCTCNDHNHKDDENKKKRILSQDKYTHDDVFSNKIPLCDLFNFSDTRNCKMSKEKVDQLVWFELSCPCRISSHKDGVCETSSSPVNTENDEGWKPAHTSFAVLAYDESTDSTLVLAKPLTGRTHQIRLHLQFLNHPIANDPNYGGDIWFADKSAQQEAQLAHEELVNHASVFGGSSQCISDIPATDEEISSCIKYEKREDESMVDFIQRTCVWCQRSKSLDEKERNILELKTRSRGIWLHALSYAYSDKQFTTRPPLWCSFPSTDDSSKVL